MRWKKKTLKALLILAFFFRFSGRYTGPFDVSWYFLAYGVSLGHFYSRNIFFPRFQPWVGIWRVDFAEKVPEKRTSKMKTRKFSIFTTSRCQKKFWCYHRIRCPKIHIYPERKKSLTDASLNFIFTFFLLRNSNSILFFFWFFF